MAQPFVLTVSDVQGQTILAKDAAGRAWTLPSSAIFGTAEKGKTLKLIATVADENAEPALARAMVNALLHES